ncbi:MAG: orotidine-5'-phosphate decarboxylase, partial [Candidatus Moranbacteria bacterium]|nr:orotidine-5'-phosphate decarboxylase [Candidatus Moranbacteria bacterium]
MQTFTDKLIEQIKFKKSVLCVGLDPQIKHLPKNLKKEFDLAFKNKLEATAECVLEFNKIVIDKVKNHAACVKLQNAFFEQYGHWGAYAFEKSIQYAKEKDLLVISDVKRGDGGDTAKAYANAHLNKVDLIDDQSIQAPFQTDAITLNINIGRSCL